MTVFYFFFYDYFCFISAGAFFIASVKCFVTRFYVFSFVSVHVFGSSFFVVPLLWLSSCLLVIIPLPFVFVCYLASYTKFLIIRRSLSILNALKIFAQLIKKADSSLFLFSTINLLQIITEEIMLLQNYHRRSLPLSLFFFNY